MTKRKKTSEKCYCSEYGSGADCAKHGSDCAKHLQSQTFAKKKFLKFNLDLLNLQNFAKYLQKFAKSLQNLKILTKSDRLVGIKLLEGNSEETYFSSKKISDFDRHFEYFENSRKYVDQNVSFFFAFFQKHIKYALSSPNMKV